MEIEESTHFLMSCLAPGDEFRDGALDLLIGDRSVLRSGRWAEASDVYVLRDPATTAAGVGAAAALTVASASGDAVEIGPVWSAPGWQEDVELCLVEELEDALRRRGVHRIVASARDSDLERIGLLTRAGFRIASGPSRDVLWFDLDL